MLAGSFETESGLTIANAAIVVESVTLSRRMGGSVVYGIYAGVLEVNSKLPPVESKTIAFSAEEIAALWADAPATNQAIKSWLYGIIKAEHGGDLQLVDSV